VAIAREIQSLADWGEAHAYPTGGRMRWRRGEPARRDPDPEPKVSV
jgi:hypothetical protein